VENNDKHEQITTTSLGQQLSWILLVCGLGLLLMGLTSSWNDAAFKQPEDGQLHYYSGILQQVEYSAPAKEPTLVELKLYHKKSGVRYGYLRYGLHAWEERLKPYEKQQVTVLMDGQMQVWGVDVGAKPLLLSSEIERRLQRMKQGQQDMAEKIAYAGGVMFVLWLLFRYFMGRDILA